MTTSKKIKFGVVITGMCKCLKSVLCHLKVDRKIDWMFTGTPVQNFPVKTVPSYKGNTKLIPRKMQKTVYLCGMIG